MLAALATSATAAFAAVPVPPAAPVLNGIENTLLGLALKYPAVSTLLLVIGGLRVAFKPIMALVDGYVKANCTPAEYGKLVHVEQSPAYRGFCFALDLLGSIKPGMFAASKIVTQNNTDDTDGTGNPPPIVASVPVPAQPSGSAAVAASAVASVLAVTILACSLFTSGCATTGQTSQGPVVLNTNTGVVTIYGVVVDPVKTAKAAQIAARVGTVFGIQKDPEAKAYLQVAGALVDDMISGGDYDPAMLQAGLDGIDMSKLGSNSAEIKSAIETAFAVYSIYSGDVLGAKLDRNAYLKPVLLAISAGIKEGLTTQAVPIAVPAK